MFSIDVGLDENWTSVVFPIDPRSWGDALVELYPFLKSIDGVESVHFSLRSPKGAAGFDVPITLGTGPNAAFRLCCLPGNRNLIHDRITTKLEEMEISAFEFDSNRSSDSLYSDSFLGNVGNLARKWGEHWEWRVRNLADTSQMVWDMANEGLLNSGSNPRLRIQVAHLLHNMLGQSERGDTLDWFTGLVIRW